MKTCTRCLAIKPETEFYRANVRTGRLAPYCKDCAKASVRASNSTPEGKTRRTAGSLWNLYKLTPADIERMTAEQGGCCKVCRGKPAGARHHSKLFVDHDHETGKIRGLLCHGCNSAIGLMKDSAGRLRAAAEYLEASR